MISNSALFLGGWSLPSIAYSGFLEQLQKTADLTVETFDYGFYSNRSGTICLPCEYDLSEQIVLAHSFGTLLALDAVAKGAQPDALILINPFPRFTVSDDGFNGWPVQQLDDMKKRLKTKPESLLRAFYRNCAVPEKFPIAIPETVNAFALEDALTVLRDTDARKGARHITCPVLLLCSGELDQIVKPEMWNYFRETLPSARIMEFEEAGHLLPMTHSMELVPCISDFLKEVL